VSKVAAIILAAGESMRMGQPKALLPWPSPSGTTTLLGHAVDSAIEAGYGPIVVVLGHDAERLRAELAHGIERASTSSARTVESTSGVARPELFEGRAAVRVVVNERYREGRATSIVTGAQALVQELDGVLVSSVDQPRSVAMLRLLHDAWFAASPRPMVAAPAYGGLAGHPVLVDASLVDALLSISEERQGLREVVHRHRATRLLVPTDDPQCLTNVNTPEDYERALALA
jgi:molybdenum cofactor cytidylyltransferase